MILNYIWISLILLALIMGLVQALAFGNVGIFSEILNSTFDSAKTGFEWNSGCGCSNVPIRNKNASVNIPTIST